MKRPYKIKNLRTGRVRSFGKAESAMNHAALFTVPGLKQYADDYVWIDVDGIEYPLPGIVATIEVLRRIYAIGDRLVAAQ